MSDAPYTRHQGPRGARPDAIHSNRMHLVKNVERLRLTYQIRLLTALAADRGMSLVLHVPAWTRVSGDLRAFVAEHPRILKIERARS